MFTVFIREGTKASILILISCFDYSIFDITEPLFLHWRKMTIEESEMHLLSDLFFNCISSVKHSRM